jgi:hypothetical protein
MQLGRMQLGFLTCWDVTWLLFCPMNERNSLYVSPPIKYNNTHSTQRCA